MFPESLRSLAKKLSQKIFFYEFLITKKNDSEKLWSKHLY